MTKIHGKRYAYKFDFNGLAQAQAAAAGDPGYRYPAEIPFFAATGSSGYHQAGRFFNSHAAAAAMIGGPNNGFGTHPAACYWPPGGVPTPSMYMAAAAATGHTNSAGPYSTHSAAAMSAPNIFANPQYFNPYTM